MISEPRTSEDAATKALTHDFQDEAQAPPQNSGGHLSGSDAAATRLLDEFPDADHRESYIRSPYNIQRFEAAHDNKALLAEWDEIPVRSIPGLSTQIKFYKTPSGLLVAREVETEEGKTEEVKRQAILQQGESLPRAEYNLYRRLLPSAIFDSYKFKILEEQKLTDSKPPEIAQDFTFLEENDEPEIDVDELEEAS